MKKVSIIIGFAIISLMFFTTSCSGPSTPGDTLKEFSYAMEKGNTDKVISMFGGEKGEMTAEDKEKLTALLASAKEEIEKKGGIKSIEIIEETISEDGKTAKVKAKTTFGDGSEDEGSSNFDLIDGEWKIVF